MGERAVLFFFSNMCVNGEPKVNVKRKHNRLTARGRADTPKGQTTRTHIYEGVSRNIYPHTKSEATESESVRVPRLVALVQAARRLSGACRGCGSAQAHADHSSDGNAGGRNGEHRERAGGGRERRRRRRRRLDRAGRAVGLGLAGVAVEACLLVQVAVRADALVVDVEVRVRLAWLG